ncbi:MAG TPA: RNA-binding protein [Stellaceae bacterium]|nr:RNA-binding protein [Stellaceae bacterium]
MPARRRKSDQTPQVAGTVIAGPPVGPQRRCIVTGEIGDRGALLRFVVGPDGAIVPDIEARLPGRGLWLSPRRDIVDRAVATRIFARAARRPVAAAPELADRIESLLARRCCDGLGLARRAGVAVAGFDRVSDALRRGKVALLLTALDGAAAGRGKLAGLAHDVPAASVLTAAELGAAFGRERIVHAAVAGGPLCRRLLLDLSRLAGLRADAAVDCGTDFAPARPAQKDGGIEAHD